MFRKRFFTPTASAPMAMMGSAMPSSITQRRNTTHAFVRTPMFHSVPSQSPNGAMINRLILMGQFRDFYRTLQQSRLVDKVHVMSERSGIDSVKVADQLSCIGSTFLGMPSTGNEARISEFMESMRYVRGAGGPSTLSTMLQDTEDCRCHSGDIVQLPNGIAVGNGPRTNQVAHDTLKQLFEFSEQYSQFEVLTIEQEGDAPPLGDYFQFAGNDILITWKDEHGMLAVDQYQQLRPDDELHVVYLEPGCHFYTFFGTDQTVDVLVQRGHERSTDALAGAGLNPIPIAWSEMDKIGVSMRSSVLMMKFLKTPLSGVLPTNTRKLQRGARWQAHQLAEGGTKDDGGDKQ